MWTRHTVEIKITDHFRMFPGLRLPAWVPTAPWNEQLAAHCWAKSKDTPIRWLCAEKGWPKSTHYRHVKRSGTVMAEALNLDESLVHTADLGVEPEQKRPPR